MKILDTSSLPDLNPDEALWVYNSYDVMLPHEILEKVDSRMTPQKRTLYHASLAFLGPAMSMMLNGVNVDQVVLKQKFDELLREETSLQKFLRSMVLAVWGKALNVQSPTQMKEFFYESDDGFGFPPKYTGFREKRRVTCNRDALEQISKEQFYARPIIATILALKDLQGDKKFLNSGVDSDGRVRCSFNVAATETTRWSSSKNPFGRGRNWQNQTEELRHIYISDERWVFAYPDLAQAESYGVAYYSADPKYIEACKSGDIHTAVCKMVWPELDWPGTPEGDRQTADMPFYRHFSYRDMAKRGGHATNYLGQPYTVAKHLNVTQELIDKFQWSYFNAFPYIRTWHREVQRELQDTGRLTNGLGIERTFFKRLDEDATLKEAIAHLPQSLISMILKLGIYKVWEKYEVGKPWVKLHGDMHDGCLMSIREARLDEIAPDIINLMSIPVQMPGGTMLIPVDFTVGYRWSKKEMPKWGKGILATLTKPDPVASLLAQEI